MTDEFVELSKGDPRLPRLPDGEAGAAPVVVDPVPEPVKASPREAAEAAIDRILQSFFKDRDSMATLIATLRTTHGVAVAHLSDEEIAREARALYTDLIRESVSRSMRKMGRDKELVIKTDGY